MTQRLIYLIIIKDFPQSCMAFASYTALSCANRIGRIFIYCLCVSGCVGFSSFYNNPLYINIFIFSYTKGYKNPSTRHNPTHCKM
uniref:Uncharacterized protein n=1 Tax=Siphoviridae sp. ctA995 TaxID=2826180 RepID=A0A8S5LYE7_9CAUD|nr:MAG TPA: hypothetical protein [Siphoviridae sp. ctA995]